MEVLDAGHRYLLKSYDGGKEQELQFMKREGARYPGNVGHCSGTNMQEVLRVLIHRTQYLNRQEYSAFNEVIVGHLRAALIALEQRAAERHGLIFFPARTDIENIPTCPTCGHVVCRGHGGS